MDEVKRLVLVDTSSVPTCADLWEQLKSGQNKIVQDIIMCERQKARYAVEKADYLRKRKMLSNLDEFEKQIDQLVAKKSKQTAIAEKAIDQAKNVLDKIDSLNKKSSVVTDLNELLDTGNAFVDSEEKLRVEYMTSLADIINIAYNEFIDTVDALLSKMPFLAHQKEAMADLDPETKKYAELNWKLGIIKKLDGFNPLAEKTDQIRKVLNEKLEEKKKKLEVLEASEKKRIQEQSAINGLDQELCSLETAMREEELKQNDELQKIFAQMNEANALTIQRQTEYIELREKLMESKDAEDEVNMWKAKLEAIKHQRSEIQVDLDCAQCELDQEQQTEMKLIKELEAEENRIKSEEDQQQKYYEELFDKSDEVQEEKKAISELHDQKFHKLDEQKNLIHSLEEELSVINEKIDAIKNIQNEKKQRKKALKKEAHRLDEAIAQLLVES